MQRIRGDSDSHCQANQRSWGRFILTLKANHPTLAKDAQNWFKKHKNQTEGT
ncbi:MAG: hypothetical protein AAFQ41_06985 [Cyanobacteria bacterium J06623_7]